MAATEALVHVLILLIADEWAAQDAKEKHADGRYAVERERPAFRKLLRCKPKSSAPQEGLAQSVNGRRGHDGPAYTLRKNHEADDGNRGTDDQKTDRGEAMNDRPRVEAQDGHDGGDVDEDPSGEVRRASGSIELEQFRHPAVRAEFCGGERSDDDEHQQEEPVAQGSGVEPNSARHDGRDDQVDLPVHFVSGHLIHGGDDKGRDDEEAHGAHFFKHVAVAHASGHALVRRKGARQNQQGINDDGNEAQGEAEFPNGIKEQFGVWQHGAEQSAQRQARWPTGVQDVQPFGLVLVEQGGDDRIDERLDGAIGHGDEECAPVERLEAGGIQR